MRVLLDRADGVDVRDIPLGRLRERITVVSQDVILFAGTLADNIALGKPFDRARLDSAVARVVSTAPSHATR